MYVSESDKDVSIFENEPKNYFKMTTSSNNQMFGF